METSKVIYLRLKKKQKPQALLDFDFNTVKRWKISLPYKAVLIIFFYKNVDYQLSKYHHPDLNLKRIEKIKLTCK